MPQVKEGGGGGWRLLPWRESIFAVFGGEFVGYTIDFDGQGAFDHVKVFVLAGVEMRWLGI